MLKSKNSKGRVGKKRQRSSQVVAAPAAVGVKSTTRVPKVSTTNGGCVVTHSEPITGVMSATNIDTVYSYAINPGDATTFPWLGQIANAWDFYQIRSLRFRYISRLPSTIYSTIVLSIDYDVLDAVPTDLVQIRQIAGAVSGNGWMPLSINWSSSGVLMGSGSRKTRVGSVPPDNLTDVGRLVIGNNTSISGICGEIWADYTVALFKPQQIAPVETFGADFPSGDDAVFLPHVSTEGESFYNFLAGQAVEMTSNLPVSVVPSPFLDSSVGGLALRFRLPWLLGHRDVHIALSNRSALTTTLTEPLATVGVPRPKIYTQGVSGGTAEMSPDVTNTWVAEFLSDALLVTATSTALGTAWNHFMSFHLRVPDNYMYTAQNTVAIIIVFLFKAYYTTGYSAPGLFYLLGSDVHVDPGPREIPNDFENLTFMRKHFMLNGHRVQVRDASTDPSGSVIAAPLSSGDPLIEPRVSKDTQSASCCTSQTTTTVTATENSPALETQRPALCPCCNRT